MGYKTEIKSNRDSELNSKFVFDGETYEVATEDLGVKKCKIVTRIYFRGQILSSTTYDYAHFVKLPDLNEKIRSMIEKQHNSARETFIKENSGPRKSKAHYAQTIRQHMTKGDNKAAFAAAEEALNDFPSDPFFLSHYGYLTGTVGKRWREGAKMCEEAVRVLKASQSTDMVFFLPVFYLNLGRVYIRLNKRVAALKAFGDGLQLDSSNNELLSEIKNLGLRKRPVIPFLDRGNPINKFLGKLRHTMQKNK
jgi:tetratricopeptide (TPR) repeat protein